MTWVRTWEDLADYAECRPEDLRVVASDDAYAIIAPGEFVDLAGKLTPSFFRTVFRELEPGRWYEVDCRRTTIGFVRRLAARGRIEFQELESWDWDGEPMVNGRFRVLK